MPWRNIREDKCWRGVKRTVRKFLLIVKMLKLGAKNGVSNKTVKEVEGVGS